MSIRLLRLIAFTTTLLAAGCSLREEGPLAAVAEAPGTAEHGMQVGDRMRTFLLHVPASRPRRLGRALAYPLVIVLHGSGANGETVRRMSRMDSTADVARFLVAYPNGVTGALGHGSDWNAGDCCGVAEDRHVDDLAFLRALIEQVAARMPVDRNRIYVAGFSDGGRMAYHAACKMGAQIAAIAVISGSLTDANCVPARAVPVIAFHGTSDRDVPYGDSSYTVPKNAPPAAENAPPSVRFWAGNNGCRGATLKRQSAHVSEMRFEPCAGAVVLYTIEGGLHAWPGGASDGQEPTQEFSASHEAWRFFLFHPLH